MTQHHPIESEMHYWVLDRELTLPRLCVKVESSIIGDSLIVIRRDHGVGSAWPEVALSGRTSNFGSYDISCYGGCPISSQTAEELRDFTKTPAGFDRVSTNFWCDQRELKALEKLLEVDTVPKDGKKMIADLVGVEYLSE